MLLGVLGKPSGVVAAGGMVVEVLPGAPEETIARLESNIAGIRGVSHLIEEGGAEHVVEQVLAGLDREVKEVRPLRYRCRCSRERLLSHLTAPAGRGPGLPARGRRRHRGRLRLLRRPLPVHARKSWPDLHTYNPPPHEHLLSSPPRSTT